MTNDRALSAAQWKHDRESYFDTPEDEPKSPCCNAELSRKGRCYGCGRNNLTMKYQLTKSRTEIELIEIEAESPADALKQARAGVESPWRVDGAVEEMREDGEITTVHELYGTCEHCEAMIFDEAEYDKGAETDDGFFCHKCVTAMPT